MSVYLVWFDNMEPYEDNFTCVEGVFSTREKAVAYIRSEGYAYGKPVKPFGWMDECWHKVGYFDSEPWDISKMSIQKWEVDA